jgi:serine protease SohB
VAGESWEDAATDPSEETQPMNLLWETLAFAAKGVVVFSIFTACLVALAVALGRARAARAAGEGGHIEVRPLGARLRQQSHELRRAVIPKAQAKALRREWRRAEAEAEARARPNVFVLDFDGDIVASAVESLREEVTALCEVAAKGDEVVVRLDSAGGAAHAYGLGAAQLERLRERGVRLTVCVDRVAASGGYMMACVADTILAAPFAILGSIGVVAPLPNLHRLLDRMGVDYENATAGAHKRTVSFLAEISEPGRKKFQEQLEETHTLFRELVRAHRPNVDIDAVATGEHWHAKVALALGLVDRLTTSDDYLLARLAEADLHHVRYRRARPWRRRLRGFARALLEQWLLDR